MTLECNSRSFKSYIFHLAMMSIKREITRELYACIHVHPKHVHGDFLMHARQQHIQRFIWCKWRRRAIYEPTKRVTQFYRPRIVNEENISALHETALCHSAGLSKFTNCQFSQILEGVRMRNFHSTCSGTYTFILQENLEIQNLTENRHIRRFSLWATIYTIKYLCH